MSLLILLAIPGLFLYPCLSFHLFEPDEGRYAEIPREMMVRGEWVVPYLQSDPYLDKPPLFYWLVMVCYRLFGVHDWSARLVPALAVHGSVLLTYWIGRRSLGERGAFWGALALGLAPGFVSVGRLLVFDSLLAFWTTLSLASAFEAIRGDRLRWPWWLLSAVACGFGVLTKGPVAVVLLAPPLWAYRRLNGSPFRIGWPALGAFLAVILAINLPWYVAVCLRMPAFAGYFFWEHNIVRFLDPFDHHQPIWFYGPILLAGLLPSSLLIIPFLRFLFSSEAAAGQRRCPELGFLLLAGGWCLLFFTLSGCKLPTYILPAFPPLALALGYYLAGSSWAKTRWPVIVSGLVMVLLGIGHYAAIPWYARFHSPMSRPEQVIRYCADRTVPVVCYPRNCDSVAFYLGRDDLRSYRSKQTPALIQFLQEQPRAVVLFTHRHSLEGLRRVLPPELRVTGETPLYGSLKWKVQGLRSLVDAEAGMCYMAVVERSDH